MNEDSIPTENKGITTQRLIHAATPVPGVFSPRIRERWQKLHRVSPFGSHVLLTMGTNIVLAGIGVITGTLVARLLGPSGRGELAAIQNLFWLIAILAMLGLPEATLFFIAREPGHGGRVVSSAIVLAFVAAPLFYFVVYPLVPLLLAAQPSNIIATTRWYLLCIPLYALMVIPTFAVRGQNNLVRWNMLRILPGLGWLLFLVAVWVVAKPTAELLAGGYLLVLALMLLPTVLVVRKHITPPFWPDRHLSKTMLTYGAPLAGATIPQILNMRLDQLLIAALLPPYLLGLYVVAVAWSGAALPLLHAIGNVLFPKIAAGDSSPAEKRRALAQGLRLGTMTGSLLALTLGALTPLAIPLLFGRAFEPAVPIALVLVVAAVVSGMNSILEEGLRGLGDTPGVLWGELAGLAITATGLALLLKPFGIMGAGIASMLGWLGTAAFLTSRIHRATGISTTFLFWPQVEDFRYLVLRVRNIVPALGLGERA